MKGGRRSVGGEAVKYRSSKKKLMGGKVGGPYTWTKWQLETFVKPDIQYRAVKYRGNWFRDFFYKQKYSDVIKDM